MRYNTLMLLLAIAPCAQAEGLGRLFFTAAQRAQLDHRQIRAAVAAEYGTGSMLMINGIVQKHGGTRTIWINGVAQRADSGGHAADKLQVTVPGKSHPVTVKVGQKLLPDLPQAASDE